MWGVRGADTDSGKVPSGKSPPPLLAASLQMVSWDLSLNVSFVSCSCCLQSSGGGDGERQTEFQQHRHTQEEELVVPQATCTLCANQHHHGERTQKMLLSRGGGLRPKNKE